MENIWKVHCAKWRKIDGLHFIVNPKSRTGQGELLWSQLEPELKKRRVSYEVRMTGRKKDAERIATEITADEEEHTMIVLGGDGSLNEVINGIKNPSKVNAWIYSYRIE